VLFIDAITQHIIETKKLLDTFAEVVSSEEIDCRQAEQ